MMGRSLSYTKEAGSRARRSSLSRARAKGRQKNSRGTEVEQYRNRAEQEFGKYIPGSLISQLRFIPGRQRTRLPLYDENRGVRREIGWIDASGVHYHFQPIISA